MASATSPIISVVRRYQNKPQKIYFHAEATDKWFVRGIEDRHKDCFTHNKHAETISTRSLTTCRQVYDEARYISYTTNTFGFDNPNIIEEFTCYLQSLVSAHHLKIHRVHLDMDLRSLINDGSWATTITHYLIPGLPEVHHISINLQQGNLHVLECPTPAEFEACRSSKIARSDVISALLGLGELQLKRVTFVISDKVLFSLFDRYRNTRLHRWTLAEKQAHARYIKESILRKDNPRVTASSLAMAAPKTDVSDRFEKWRLLGG